VLASASACLFSSAIFVNSSATCFSAASVVWPDVWVPLMAVVSLFATYNIASVGLKAEVVMYLWLKCTVSLTCSAPVALPKMLKQQWCSIDVPMYHLSDLCGSQLRLTPGLLWHWVVHCMGANSFFM
jgi:hypothetical protein